MKPIQSQIPPFGHLQCSTRPSDAQSTDAPFADAQTADAPETGLLPVYADYDRASSDDRASSHFGPFHSGPFCHPHFYEWECEGDPGRDAGGLHAALETLALWLGPCAPWACLLLVVAAVTAAGWGLAWVQADLQGWGQ